MLNFVKTFNRYNAIGYNGTCYTIEEDNGYYYPEHDNTEWDSLQEAIAHCELCNECESLLDTLANMGVKAFNHMGNCIDLRLDLDSALYIWTPNSEATVAFCEWTCKMVECFKLDHATEYDNSANTHLYRVANSDRMEYREMDGAIANIILNASQI